MTSKLTEGIIVSVETSYQPELSNPLLNEFMFAYRVTIENNNNFPVQLLSRHWFIFDSTGSMREVEGEGVVGVQPIIEPGEYYQYSSGCNLKSEMGRMHGTYLIKNIRTNRSFKVAIPAFEMEVPFKLN
ncbi:MAG TPA: Co2+/Mg2+ efflux protein ApaG [Ferruginibacter sp.]|nr:Co2+/Mg2+ efflux protein ApaG [Ferruginibacter sp.]HRE64616.1 Co2+/Mg2+ efflux protein ApaG [Ferruginibacter sp.]